MGMGMGELGWIARKWEGKDGDKGNRRERRGVLLCFNEVRF